MEIAILLLVLLLLGLPIYLCLGLTALTFFYLGDLPMTFAVKSWYSGVDQYALIAVSGFLLVGYLLEESGITQTLIALVQKMVGAYRSGLAIVTILSCALFAAIIGSGPATVATIGGIMIPSMIAAGYKPQFAGSVAVSGGALGILIPPSNPFLIFGIIAGVSIGELFAAGLLPGLIMAVALSITSMLVLRRDPTVSEAKPEPRKELNSELIADVWNAKWAIFAIVLLLGGIYSGLFTPIESAEVTIFYAIIIGFFVTRKLTLAGLWRALQRTLLLSGTLILLVAAAEGFGRLLTIMQVPQDLAVSILSMSDDPLVILFIILAFLIFVGTWAETFSMIVVLTPIFLPIVASLGIDPIHFGVLFVVVAEIGFLTPPFGANLFVGMKIAKVSLEKISLATIPFVLTYIVVLVLLVLFPQISLWLPGLLFD